MGFLRSRTRNTNYIVQGKIPESLSIFSRPVEVIKRDIGAMTEEVEVRPSYVCDKASKKAHENAEQWAKGGWRGNSGMPFTREDRDNVPFTGLRIWDLEVRSEGGRAYKAITPDNMLIDLREDVFLEALITQGIGVGGELGGDYVFAFLGSQMRVVRVGSDLHAGLEKTTERKKTKPIADKDLVIGGVYRGKSGDVEIYCGHVMDDGKKKQFWVKSWAYGDALNAEKIQEDFSQHATGLRHEYDHATKSYTPTTQRQGMYRVTLRQSHSFIERLHIIDVGDRSKYFHIVDVQKYPEGGNYYWGSSRLNPIYQERTWTFVD